jgi:hypothetical protein
MDTIGKLTEEIIHRSPFLKEALNENLINVSSLARKIRPEIEEITRKEVKEGAIIMAIKRMEPGRYHQINLKIRNTMGELGDFLIRSNLEDYTFENSETLAQKQLEFMDLLSKTKDAFYTISRGVSETTLIVNESFGDDIRSLFSNEKIKTHTKKLSSLTIKLPTINTEISGVYYFILKHLAWEGINIVEIVSTANEFSIIVKQEDVEKAFKVLINLKIEKTN